mgnify:CR=1 FL=1
MSSFAVESITDDAKEELNKYKVKLCCEIRFLAISCHDFFQTLFILVFVLKTLTIVTRLERTWIYETLSYLPLKLRGNCKEIS